MNDKAMLALLSTIKAMPEGSEAAALSILQAAADSIFLSRLNTLNGQTCLQNQYAVQQEKYPNELKFNREDINKMPRTYRKLFRTNGVTAHVYKRRSGKRTWNYEVRCQINNQDVYASSNNLEEAKKKFIARLQEIDSGLYSKSNAIPNTIDAFAEYFFENFYKRKVVASTLRIAKNQYKNHVAPHFRNITLKRITPAMCQSLLDRLDEEGKGKTADDVHTILNIIFKAAVKHRVMPFNPLDMVFHTKHEREHGSALTKEEEKLLLEKTAGTPQQRMFAIALFTGMRPNEYETAVLDGDFIVAVNSKRKNGKVEYKKIPVTPMLAPFLEGVDKIEFCSMRTLRGTFNRLLPSHRLYDLRTTFYTRCQECGVADVAIKKFVGHTLGGLTDTYTDLSDEFLLREGQKFKY